MAKRSELLRRLARKIINTGAEVTVTEDEHDVLIDEDAEPEAHDIDNNDDTQVVDLDSRRPQAAPRAYRQYAPAY